MVTRADAASGRGRRLAPCPTKEVAVEAGIAVLDPLRPRGPEFVEALARLEPDLGVVVAYGRILPRAVLEVPRLGCINAHGSLLPALRGAAPIERAILSGRSKTGVTIMQMDEGMDTGAMLFQETVDMSDQPNAGVLAERMAELSASMFLAAIEEIEAGRARATPQDPTLVSLAPPLRRSESRIDWQRGAAAIVRQVRAFAPRPGAFTFDRTRRLKVLEARELAVPAADRAPAAGLVLGPSPDGIRVACGEGLLELISVQPEGKRAMTALDYARGGDALAPGSILGA